MQATRYSMSGVGTPTDLRPGESKRRLVADPELGMREATPRDELSDWLDEAQANVDAGWRALGAAEQNRIEVMTGKRLQQMPPPPREEPTAEPAEVKKLTPDSAALGSPSFTLHVKGQNFVETDVILWNGSPEPTTFVDDKELTTGVNMETAAVAMEIPVSVQSADGLISNWLTFELKELTAAARGVPAGKHAPKATGEDDLKSHV
jgi:hypothetical protein